VSGFQLRFSSDRVYTPGDECDVLVAMNAAALKVNLNALKKAERSLPMKMDSTAKICGWRIIRMV
jgi:Pyruvate/2-oxoacid:ferredoxin oxidoreductase gamma subunit